MARHLDVWIFLLVGCIEHLSLYTLSYNSIWFHGYVAFVVRTGPDASIFKGSSVSIQYFPHAVLVFSQSTGNQRNDILPWYIGNSALLFLNRGYIKTQSLFCFQRVGIDIIWIWSSILHCSLKKPEPCFWVKLVTFERRVYEYKILWRSLSSSLITLMHARMKKIWSIDRLTLFLKVLSI